MRVGLGVDDLPEIYRAEYLHAIELARAQHEPHSDWEGFVDALWGALVPAFGLDVARDDAGGQPSARSDVTPPS